MLILMWYLWWHDFRIDLVLTVFPWYDNMTLGSITYWYIIQIISDALYLLSINWYGFFGVMRNMWFHKRLGRSLGITNLWNRKFASQFTCHSSIILILYNLHSTPVTLTALQKCIIKWHWLLTNNKMHNTCRQINTTVHNQYSHVNRK